MTGEEDRWIESDGGGHEVIIDIDGEMSEGGELMRGLNVTAEGGEG